jgi:hypothetical protein
MIPIGDRYRLTHPALPSTSPQDRESDPKPLGNPP